MSSLLEKIDKKLENIYITDESNINNKIVLKNILTL